jgi:hypothetical protein
MVCWKDVKYGSFCTPWKETYSENSDDYIRKALGYNVSLWKWYLKLKPYSSFYPDSNRSLDIQAASVCLALLLAL